MPVYAEYAIYGVLVIALVVGVYLFMRWSQRNIHANTQRIKQFQHLEDATAAAGAPGVHAPDDTQDTARDLVEQLDSRIAEIQELLRAADDRIARLERAVRRPE